MAQMLYNHQQKATLRILNDPSSSETLIIATREKLSHAYNQFEIKFNDITAALNDLTSTKEIETKLAELIGSFQGVSDQHCEAEAKAMEILRKLSAHPGSSSSASSHQPTEKHYALPMKLPKQEVDKFSGNRADPMTFHRFSIKLLDVFKCHPHMSNDQKVIFLRSCLQGPPLSLVINITDFDTAWELLTKQYFEKRRALDAVIAELSGSVNLGSISSIRDYISKIKFKVSELTTLEKPCQPDSCADAILGYLVRSNLPAYFKQEVARRAKNETPTLAEILACAHDVCVLFESTPRSGSKSSKTQSGSQHQASSSKTFTTVYQSSDNSSSKPSSSASAKSSSNCKFCNSGDHRSSGCIQYTTVKTRKSRAKELGLCTKCLVKGHEASACGKSEFPFPCGVCGKNSHIQPFCFKADNTSSKSDRGDNPTQTS